MPEQYFDALHRRLLNPVHRLCAEDGALMSSENIAYGSLFETVDTKTYDGLSYETKAWYNANKNLSVYDFVTSSFQVLLDCILQQNGVNRDEHYKILCDYVFHMQEMGYSGAGFIDRPSNLAACDWESFVTVLYNHGRQYTDMCKDNDFDHRVQSYVTCLWHFLFKVGFVRYLSARETTKIKWVREVEKVE